MKKILVILFIIPLISFAQTSTETMIKKGMDTTKYIPLGLQVGDMAPIIVGRSLNGEHINSGEILKEKNIVLIFYRGEWCPICSRYLSNLNDSLKYIVDENAEIFVVGPETFENATKTIKKTKGDFILIPDTLFQIEKDYDVMFNVTKKYQGKIKTFLRTDIAKNNNQEEATLPVPATYIIGQDGLIKWRHFNYNYSERATIKEIIDNLK
ncbi:MAG: redoxin domain-containing protein [Flavobacteriales bacterium]|nr:redoxin domain-containing protein [Flavobacteriales bacterium]